MNARGITEIPNHGVTNSMVPSETTYDIQVESHNVVKSEKG